jgi:hypothetical protein
MEDDRALISAHPQGEVESGERDQDLVDRSKAVETFGGKVFVRWDAEAAVTAFAPVTYFLEFLKANGYGSSGLRTAP